jgi:hypothetical protein
MSLRYLLILLGLILIGVGLAQGGWSLLAVWFGCNFLVLGIAHVWRAHGIFGKRPDGSLPLWSWAAFCPLILYTIAGWHLLRLINREPAHNLVTDNLIVGRRLLPSEVEGEFTNYVDLTTEFSEPCAIRRSKGYLCFPILDGSAPDIGALREAIQGLRPGRTYIHCAQGHGRTGLFALALMLHTGVVRTVNEGLEKLKAVRPRVGLSVAQQQCIEEFAKICRENET